jgi:membrane protease YdiL (CAAX protease family)
VTRACKLMGTTYRPMVNALLGCMLLVLFSYFIHDVLPLRVLAFAALGAMAFLISMDRGDDRVLGTMKNRRSLSFGIMIAIAGALLAVYYLRDEANMPIIPKSLGWFAILAAIIGSTEELVFRGWMQSQFSGRFAWAGILFAAFAHAAYKSALFLSPEIMYDLNTLGLFRMTFLAGIFLGSLRYYTGSVWPALLAHGIFDLLVYADSEQTWWVF